MSTKLRHLLCLSAVVSLGVMTTLARAADGGAEGGADASDEPIDDASDEGPVGLQPTVFDSNLGCAVATAHSPPWFRGPVVLGGAIVLLSVLRRQRRR